MTDFCDMVFDRVFGKQRPTAQEAARRLLILQSLAVYAQTVPMGKQLHQSSGLSEAAKSDMHRIMGGMFSKRLQESGLWDYVSPWEQEFFASPVQNLPEQQVVDASWRREAVVPLMVGACAY